MAKAKSVAGMDCAGEAAAGIRLVLSARLAEMCELREAALEWTDIEGVHDMRVASRRLRSALRDFAPYTRKRRLARVRDELKSIADALGAVRDEDVRIAALAKLATKAPAGISAGIEAFVQAHAWQREAAREELSEAITAERLESLQAEFARSLERATKPHRRGKKFKGDDVAEGDVSLRAIGSEIITKRFAELQALSASLYRPHEPEPLHRMRIAAKRLRYAVELFAPCWKDSITAFESEIGKLQTSLGELHDCDVWIADFGAQLSNANPKAARQQAKTAARRHDDEAAPTGDAAAEAAIRDGAPHTDDELHASQRRAAVWLLDDFVKARTRHFRDALARWVDWENTNFASRLQASLEHAPSTHSLELAPVTFSAVESVNADLAERAGVDPAASDAPE